jgi:hypothetical protein
MEVADDDIDAPLVATIGLGGALIIFVTIVLVKVMFHDMTADENYRKRAKPTTVLIDQRNSEKKALGEYGWVDSKTNTVHIPIKKAMKTVVEREHARRTRKAGESKP